MTYSEQIVSVSAVNQQDITLQKHRTKTLPSFWRAMRNHLTVGLLSLSVISSGMLISIPDNAHAASCAPRSAMVDYLTKKYKEEVKAMGLVSTKGIMEIMVSESGSWSILMTMANGKTCIVAAGQNWEDFPGKNKGPKV